MKEIIIKKIEDKQNDYIAYFKNDFLKSTFYVSFTDSIIGALALNQFYQMLKNKYERESFNFVLSDEEVKFKNEHLLNQVTDNAQDFKEKIPDMEAVK